MRIFASLRANEPLSQVCFFWRSGCCRRAFRCIFFRYRSKRMPLQSLTHAAGRCERRPSHAVLAEASLPRRQKAQCSMFKVQGSRFNVQCSMFNVQCSRFKVQGSMFNVQCSMFNVQCSRFNVQCSRFRPLC